jgi:hypothetical protein
MSNSIGERLIAHFGEDFVRELSENFPNATIPGEKFWASRQKDRFLKHLSDPCFREYTPKKFAQHYDVSLRSIYVWLRAAARAKKNAASPSLHLSNTRSL